MFDSAQTPALTDRIVCPQFFSAHELKE